MEPILGQGSELGLGDHDRIDPRSYTSSAIFEAEKEKIFRKAWLMVGRVSEIPEPGDFIKRDLWTLDTEAVIVRGRKDGVIRAFYNACPHRGVALVRECQGRTGRFTCPYHAWSFGTDGRLLGMPGAEDFPQIDRSTIGLTPIQCDVWNDHIFINFAVQPDKPASYRQAFAEAFMLASTRDVVTEDISMTRLQQIGLKSGGVATLYPGENEPLIRFMNQQIQSWLNAD